MKMQDLDRARKAGERLKSLEAAMAYFSNAKLLEVSGRDGSYRIELGDYPEPSELGRAFFAVQNAMVCYYETAIEDQKAELTKLGVQL